MGYPEREDERQVLLSHRVGEPVDHLETVVDCESILALQSRVREVSVETSLEDYILDIVTATRECDELQVGVSTRGALSLYRAAQSWAVLNGRDFVVPDDIKRLAVSVLGHRVFPRGYHHGSARRDVVESIVERLVAETPAPD